MFLILKHKRQISKLLFPALADFINPALQRIARNNYVEKFINKNIAKILQPLCSEYGCHAIMNSKHCLQKNCVVDETIPFSFALQNHNRKINNQPSFRRFNLILFCV